MSIATAHRITHFRVVELFDAESDGPPLQEPVHAKVVRLGSSSCYVVFYLAEFYMDKKGRI